MKFLLEFAKFKDMVKTTDPYLNNIIKSEFQEDTILIDNVYIPDYNKNISLKWNDKYYHSIIDRIKDRTSFNSISDFNSVVEYGFDNVFPDEIEKTIKEGGRYALHFNNHNFYLIISLNYQNLFDDNTEIFIITLSTITSEEDIIEIYDD